MKRRKKNAPHTILTEMKAKLSYYNNGVEFDKWHGRNAVDNDEEFRGSSCGNAIYSSIDSPEGEFSAWAMQKSHCLNKFLKAMVIFSCAAIDSKGAIVKKDKRSMLGEAISALYNPVWSVPYHNSVHAADKMHRIINFMEGKHKVHDIRLKDYLKVNEAEYLAMLIAAAGHDAGHSGDFNGMARELKTFVGLNYNGILEHYACDLMMGLLIGKYDAKKKEYKDLFFIDIFKADTTDPYFADSMPEEIAIREKALWGLNALKIHYKGGFFSYNFFGSSLKYFLGLVREAIYTTTMNPFDNRYQELWLENSFEKKDFGAVTSKYARFDFSRFAETIKPILLKNIDYYETTPLFLRKPGVEYKTTGDMNKLRVNSKLDEYESFLVGDEEGKIQKVSGMANLKHQSPQVQAKWFLLSEINHLCDIGNGFYGLNSLKPWYEKLMMEWALLSCYKQKKGQSFFMYSPKQRFFQIQMVLPAISRMAKVVPGFYFDDVVLTRMHGLDTEDLDSTIVPPLFNAVKEKYDSYKGESDKCPTVFKFYSGLDYNLYWGHQIGGDDAFGSRKKFKNFKKRKANR